MTLKFSVLMARMDKKQTVVICRAVKIQKECGNMESKHYDSLHSTSAPAKNCLAEMSTHAKFVVPSNDSSLSIAWKIRKR